MRIPSRLFRESSTMRLLAVVTVLLMMGTAAVEGQRTAVPRSGGGGGGGGGARGGGGGSVSSGGGRSVGSSHRPSGGGRSAVPRAGRNYSRPHRQTGSYRRPGRGRGGSDGRYYGGSYYPYYYRGHYGYGYGRSYFGFSFGYPYYYGGYPYYYGFSPYPAYYRPYGSYYPYPVVAVGDTRLGYTKADLGAVSLKVKPKNAEVYVDGSYVGAAKSFDGSPRYLWLAPGRHDLTLSYPGYANLQEEIEIVSGEVLQYSLELEEGVATRPEALGPQGRGRRGYGRSNRDPPDGALQRPPVVSRAPIERDVREEPGGLLLAVGPGDASVYLDGRFVGTGREVSSLRSPLLVDPGTHTLQVIHPDYLSEDVEFEVSSGAERSLEIFLAGKV